MYLVVRVESWEDTCNLARRLGGRAFRGQSDAQWGLVTSLERAVTAFRTLKKLVRNREDWMLRQFRRRAHHYHIDLPDQDNSLDWLALIQHYGGPTRLLDFSHSFYVAAFFAMERANSDAAVWAVSLDPLGRAVKTRLGLSGPLEVIQVVRERHNMLANELLTKGTPLPIAFDVEPERMHERLSIQQGLFLMPGDVTLSFEENLSNTLNIVPSMISNTATTSYEPSKHDYAELRPYHLIKIILPRAIHKTALYELNEMNMNSSTLFPGLDGFARSLYLHLRVFEA